MPIDAGRLNKRIGIYKPTRGKDLVGGATTAFHAVMARWAEIRLGGRETESAGQTVDGSTGTMKVRWEDAFQEASTDWRIEYRGRMYDVVGVTNEDEDNEAIIFDVAQVPTEPQ